MYSKKRSADEYPEFSADMTDSPRSARFGADQTAARRDALHDRDIEHAPIVFDAIEHAGNEWSSIPDDDSDVVLTSMPGTVREPDYAYSEAAEFNALASPALDDRYEQRTSSAPSPSLRWLRIIITCALGITLVVTAIWGLSELRNPDTLPLRSVRIEGAFTHVTTEGLQQAIAGATGRGFLYANVDALRQAALQVPWVRSVNVRRVWPDTLHVSVTEHAAAARWGDQALLSTEGKIFSPELVSYPPGLPELHGPAGTQALVLKQYRDMTQAIASLNLHIKRLDLDARRAWRLSLDNGTELLLGRADSNAHLQRFVQVYPSLLAAPAGDVIARVDMRYGNGLAVRWGKKPT